MQWMQWIRKFTREFMQDAYALVRSMGLRWLSSVFFLVFHSPQSLGGDTPDHYESAMTCTHLILQTNARRTVDPTQTAYASGRRSLEHIESILPADWVTGIYKSSRSEEFRVNHLAGLRVLDAGCGMGVFVKDLRALGVDAYGIDRRSELKVTFDKYGDPISQGQEIFRPFEGEASRYLFQDDMRATRFKDETIDIIFSTNSLFYLKYDGFNREVVREALIELKRILKPSGFIRIADIPSVPIRPEEDPIRSVVDSIPGLRITRYVLNWYRFVEIEKHFSP